MQLGQITIVIAFFAALVAAYYFYREGGDSRSNRTSAFDKVTIPYGLYLVSVAGAVASAFFLFYVILTHQYQYSYVAHYSSNNLPLLYLISAFWAGQEGTFLLWVLMVSVMGWVFLRTSKQRDGYAMSVVSAFSAFLYLLLIVKSPFETVASSPPDGSGLNPLLQNPWMVIHPPILFMGYAATLFPFALVVSGLARRNYDQWYARGFSWTLFPAVSLGAGIIIGGYWAYEVLGWGGYWGWDPVENSSLVPWLILLALIHGLLVQKAKGGLMRTNLFFALLSFVLVLYATFLTRSGILADFSVHSFVDLGISNYLIAVMVMTVGLGFGLFVTRFKGIKSPKIDTSNLNREVALLLSLFVLSAGALFTFVGMSSPILTGLVTKASQVDISFYNKVNLPVAIGIALLLGITPFLGWAGESISAFLKRLSMPLSLTLLACIIAYVAGVTSTVMLIFVGSASFGVISNVIIAFRQYRSGWKTLGGPIAHIGVGLLLIGIIGSGSFDESKKMILKPNEPQSAHGYQFTFKGVTQSPDKKDQIQLEVSDGKGTYMASPKLYFSEYNQSMMREPDIKVLPLKDLYISPIDLQSQAADQPHPMIELSKGEKKDLGGYQLQFVRFETGQHGAPGAMSVGAVLQVDVHGEQHEVVPTMTIDERGERKLVPADLPTAGSMGQRLSKPQVALAGMSVEEKKVMLELLGFDDHIGMIPVQELVVDVSTKPLMMAVWTGVVFIIGGMAIALRRRTMMDVVS